MSDNHRAVVITGSQRAGQASIDERVRPKRAKIAPTRDENGKDVSVRLSYLYKPGGQPSKCTR
ncbi:MAG TPA: hypothetical protein VE135_06955 [Pyrinomonadaceae bacterium]|nr:hypothetical protein [Pyrinomonadaceae bacterium]